MAEFRAPKSDRLDRILREAGFKGSEWLSRQAWDWLLENGHVFVNERRAIKAGTTIKENDLLRVDLPRELGLAASSDVADPVWKSSDRTLAVFYKPPGMQTLPLVPWDQSTFASRVAAFTQSAGWMEKGGFGLLAEPPSLEGGLLQRLDRDTSGLLCAAFTPERKALFRQLFSSSAFEKTYLALTTAVPPEGTHKIWLAGSGGPRVKAMLEAKADTEPCSVTVRVRERNAHGALVEITTRGGARHIVRASLGALGAPLLGDQVYGGSEAEPFHQLHAAGLRFLEPRAFPAFPETLEAPPPETFLASAARLGLHCRG
ncbi:MAG: pseudouridine synthase [Bdellovibrionota bacterium]